MLRQCEIHEQHPDCLLPYDEQLIHFSVCKGAVSLSFLFFCLTNACSATIISAQVG
jgi:hypothetical protein